MKKAINIIFIVIGVLVLALYGIRTYTKSHSPYEKLEAKGSKDLKVNVGYCRPLMKDRKVFGELVPYETVWRTGANESTTISFSRLCSFGKKKVKAGKYSLWTIPGEKYWTIILNNETGQWGTNYDETKDYLRFKVEAGKTIQATEQLTIKLIEKENDLIEFTLNWENTELIIPIH
ncbi:DUF2911 domain-containing protein [Lacihabitans sp. LS3-19]|uniref:DUF2911 domain-containing protein n=1 Tax=Lacihabitans sp. LS3-19 TaxID=2487335 RepID=UPI0020CC491A|nr:DUF2911 domain-containing protein [Lacihabitans sp. LS3-19]MCP9769698.1 DUF2911 domain-containing protein [Lacihabitans sp. LS3-19]